MTYIKNKTRKFIYAIIIVSVTAFLWFMPASFFGASLGSIITVTQQRTFALFIFAAMMWIFELVPSWVTSITVIVFALLTVSDKCIWFLQNPGDDSVFISFKTILSAFADPVIMLFMGGFTIAIVVSKYGLDTVFARVLLRPFGKKPKFVLLGFLVVISTFSMFMSDTATSAMFLAFLGPVVATLPQDEKGKAGLTLAIPFAANVGGIGTPIGTPPNATAKGILDSNGYIVTFGEWAVRMIPYVIIMILIIWGLLLLFFPFKSDEINFEIKRNSHRKTWRDYVVWVTLFTTIILWMTEQWTGLSSNVVALIPLAVFSAIGAFTEKDISKIEWSVLWLVAGGFALGYAMEGTGLAKTFFSTINFGDMDVIVLILAAGLSCFLISNFISNSASAALIIPIMVAMGKEILKSSNADKFSSLGGQHAIAIFVAICASLAMTLPISTPSNALASSTGFVNTKDMAKVGIIVGIIGIALGYFWITDLFPFAQA